MTDVLAASATARISTVQDSAQLSASARSLLTVTEQACIESGFDWFQLQAQHVLGPDGGARWLSLHVGEQCKAVWPIQLHRKEQPAGALSNYYTALYTPSHAPGLSHDELAAMARAMRSGPLRSGTHYFSPMDPESGEFVAMEAALRQAGFKTARYFRFINWYLPCEGMTWEQYFADRKSAVRNTIRRMGKKLATDGGQIEIIMGGDRLEVGIAGYEAVYAASWKQVEPFPGFIRALMQTCAEKGWLRLAIAWLDGRAIAAQFWIVAHGRAEIFKVAYDEAFKSHTAGTLLTAALMEHVLDRDRVREVDYLIADDPYKKTWMSHSRERWGLVAFDPTTLSGLAGMARHRLGEVRKRMRANANASPDAAE